MFEIKSHYGIFKVNDNTAAVYSVPTVHRHNEGESAFDSFSLHYLPLLTTLHSITGYHNVASEAMSPPFDNVAKLNMTTAADNSESTSPLSPLFKHLGTLLTLVIAPVDQDPTRLVVTVQGAKYLINVRPSSSICICYRLLTLLCV